MNTNPTRSFEGGHYFEQNGIKILNLYGTWKQMGRQYGHLAAGCLDDVFHNFLRPKMDTSAKMSNDIVQMAQALYQHYPYRLKQVMSGMSETSGLSLDEIILANAVEYTAAVYNCSAMAVWNEYASKHLVYGRNYDGFGFQPLCHDILLVVYHPTDGSLAMATIGYAGEIYVVNGINEKGIFVELNNGMPSAGSDFLFDRFAGTTELMTLLLDADNMDYIDAFFRTTKGFASFIIGVTDGQEARSYEWCAQDQHRGDGSTPDGLMVMTNHYVSPEWNYPTPTNETSWDSLTRRQNLLTLAEKHKGNIHAEMLQNIMGTVITNGGPMSEQTLYQLVFEPATMTLRMRITDVCDWQKIDMGELLCY